VVTTCSQLVTIVLCGPLDLIYGLFYIRVCAAPYFEIRHPSLIHYRSEVFERTNKRDRHIEMVLSSPVVLGGDVMVEFFNKPKMMKKVIVYTPFTK